MRQVTITFLATPLACLMAIKGFADEAEQAPIPQRDQADTHIGPPSTLPEQNVTALTLQDVEKRILSANLAVQAARSAVAGAQAQRRIAGQVPNPTFTAGAEQFPTVKPDRDIGKNSQTGAQNTYTLRLDQTIEVAGKRGYRIAQAMHQLALSEHQVADSMRQQLTQARLDFVNALLAIANGNLAREELNLVDQEEDGLKRQVDAGNLPENDLLRFQISRVEAEKNVQTADLAFHQALSDLRSLLDVDSADVHSVDHISGDLADPLPPDPGLDTLKSYAASRPDVLAALAAVQSARSALGLARALRYPDPTIGAEFQRVGGDNTIGVVVSVPLPAYSNHGGDIALAEAQVSQAEFSYRQVLRQSISDIEKGHAALESARALLSLYRQNVIEKAQTALKRSESAYLIGAASFVDLAEARRSYSQIRTASNQAQADGWTAFYQLEMAVAGRWLTDDRSNESSGDQK